MPALGWIRPRGPHQCGLARAVRTEHADELAGAYGQADFREDRPAADLNGGPVEFDDIHKEGCANAFCRSSSCDSIQS